MSSRVALAAARSLPALLFARLLWRWVPTSDAPGVPFLRHAGGRAAAASFASLACASSSASRASVVALGADERRAAGAPFLRHAGGRAGGGVVRFLARASSSAPRMKIDVIEHILRFLGADPLN